MSAKTTSPFALVHDEDSPWILWRQQDSLSTLMDASNTDDESVFEGAYSRNTDDQSVNIMPISTFIQRRQYNAILSRFDQASHRVGNFSAWTTT